MTESEDSIDVIFHIPWSSEPYIQIVPDTQSVYAVLMRYPSRASALSSRSTCGSAAQSRLLQRFVSKSGTQQGGDAGRSCRPCQKHWYPPPPSLPNQRSTLSRERYRHSYLPVYSNSRRRTRRARSVLRIPSSTRLSKPVPSVNRTCSPLRLWRVDGVCDMRREFGSNLPYRRSRDGSSAHRAVAPSLRCR